jgi:hypothetical protein
MACGGGAGLAGPATYPGLPAYRFTVPLLAWALLTDPLIGLVACGYIRLIGRVTGHVASGRVAPAAPAVAFGVLALLGRKEAHDYHHPPADDSASHQ